MNSQANNEPAPRDASLSRAERRRLAAGKGDVPGILGCKFCKTTVGTYVRRGNRFLCKTEGCKGRLLNEKVGGI